MRVFVLLLTMLHAGELEYLTKEKQDIQGYKSKEIDAAYEQLKYEWLNPLSVILSTRQDNSAQDISSETQSTYLSLSQDIFRSGGIYYAIRYAGSKYAYDRMTLEEENAALAQKLFTTLLTIKRTRYQLAQSETRLKNKEIEILIKRQQYEAGDVDITLLNNAIMDRNAEQKILTNLKTTLNNARIDLKKLTDRKEDEIPLPTFTLAEKENYLKQNYAVAKLREQSRLTHNRYAVTRAGYLPKLGLNGQYGTTDYTNDDLGTSYSGDYYYVGLQLSIPLDFTTGATLQEAKVNALKTQSQTLDREREEDAYYDQIRANIDAYKEYISLTRENLALYDDLITATAAGVETGYRSGYDLETLRNTKRIDEYEIRINELNIQLELVKLHYLAKGIPHD